MLKDIKPRERITEDLYEIRFFKDEDGGFAFPCDKDGNLFPMTEAARKNYVWCMANPERFRYCWNKKHHYQYTYTQEAIGKCECGAVVTLRNQYLGACECENCGRWYNLFGQELKDPKYWEED